MNKLTINDIVFEVIPSGIKITKTITGEVIAFTEDESLEIVDGILSIQEAVIKSQKGEINE